MTLGHQYADDMLSIRHRITTPAQGASHPLQRGTCNPQHAECAVRGLHVPAQARKLELRCEGCKSAEALACLAKYFGGRPPLFLTLSWLDAETMNSTGCPGCTSCVKSLAFAELC